MRTLRDELMISRNLFKRAGAYISDIAKISGSNIQTLTIFSRMTDESWNYFLLLHQSSSFILRPRRETKGFVMRLFF